MNFPAKLIALIMKCVSTSSMAVLWNGSVTDYFFPTRGLRQGDPLSPYLFVMYMEKLSSMIDMAVNMETWNPIVPCRGGPHLSHMFFTDDLIMFSKANPQEVKHVMHVINRFCNMLGQNLSLAKSRIFFSTNCNTQKMH